MCVLVVTSNLVDLYINYCV